MRLAVRAEHTEDLKNLVILLLVGHLLKLTQQLIQLLALRKRRKTVLPTTPESAQQQLPCGLADYVSTSCSVCKKEVQAARLLSLRNKGQRSLDTARHRIFTWHRLRRGRAKSQGSVQQEGVTIIIIRQHKFHELTATRHGSQDQVRDITKTSLRQNACTYPSKFQSQSQSCR